MFLLIDNYDSFTWNLYHVLGEALAQAKGVDAVDVLVRRNDALTPDEAMAMAPEAIILSPGPCDPDRAGVCLPLIEAAAPSTPIFGVCLGHQAIGQAFGGAVVRAGSIMHGKTSPIRHQGESVFEGLPDPLTAARYHSLTLEPDTLPECLEVTARTEDGVIMGVAHKTLNVHGVQFHPESVATEHGHALLTNFLRRAGVAKKGRARSTKSGAKAADKSSTKSAGKPRRAARAGVKSP